MAIRPIGGFFELETGFAVRSPHPHACALSNGRACLHVILRESRPQKIHLPFYCCDALLEPCRALQISFEFYSLNAQLEPIEAPRLERDEMVLYVNYFGLKRSAADAIVRRYRSQAIVDNTHAFYEQRQGTAWSFNSARKMFGVPDGGYLYAPRPLQTTFAANPDVRTDHLVARLIGRSVASHDLFRQSEAAQVAEPYQMSPLAERVLANVNHDRVQLCRLEHFAAYDAAFSGCNQLRLRPGAGEIPFCYPLLPHRPIEPRSLHQRHIYVPTLWQEVIARPGHKFDWERRLAGALLPLPIDHRLTADDVQVVIAEVQGLLR